VFGIMLLSAISIQKSSKSFAGLSFFSSSS